jgi:hypothetical protein
MTSTKDAVALFQRRLVVSEINMTNHINKTKGNDSNYKQENGRQKNGRRILFLFLS